ncbi:MAG: hypothetical protein E7562_03045 [Ruminococcaceae bacterium]|nr:hypothetical protein [Oscillospiraceae bacterium]
MSFPLAGNEKLKDTLLSALNADRLPHAILIEGDDGLGKHTLASFLAKSALCKENATSCTSCNSCHLFEAGTHPDYELVAPQDGKKSLSVDAVRDIRAKAFIKPHISSKRVFVFERCDSMDERAQNALLKVLEEPPRGVIFILLTLSRTTLLDTIISRCTVLTLSAPTKSQALEVLKQKCSLDTSVLSDALDQTGNNIGAALSLFSQKRKDETAETAKRFLELMLDGREYEQMKLLIPFEKDRIATDRLFASLKKETAVTLRLSRNNTARSRTLNKFYARLCEYEKLLKTNINLSLLFSALVCKGASDRRG